MKNRDQYKEFLDDCLVDHVGFGVDKDTNEPKLCSDLDCQSDCKIYGTCGPCNECRRKWLDQEADKWAGFRDLERGDVVFVKKETTWMPVIFLGIGYGELVYTSCVDDDGSFISNSDCEDDPRMVRKDIGPVVLRYESKNTCGR